MPVRRARTRGGPRGDRLDRTKNPRPMLVSSQRNEMALNSRILDGSYNNVDPGMQGLLLIVHRKSSRRPAKGHIRSLWGFSRLALGWPTDHPIPGSSAQLGGAIRISRRT
jgi:hypothetical protein